MIFYFTATGNSLYVAKQLDDKRFSIPQELNKTNRHYKDDRIGIVCPLFEFDIPDIVKKFIRGSEFETDYFYIVITYGCHDGAVADRVQKNLKYDGKQAQYITSIKMVDNALLVFDMKKEKEIEHTKKIEEKLVITHPNYYNFTTFLSSDMNLLQQKTVLKEANYAFFGTAFCLSAIFSKTYFLGRQTYLGGCNCGAQSA